MKLSSEGAKEKKGKSSKASISEPQVASKTLATSEGRRDLENSWSLEIIFRQKRKSCSYAKCKKTCSWSKITWRNGAHISWSPDSGTKQTADGPHSSSDIFGDVLLNLNQNFFCCHITQYRWQRAQVLFCQIIWIFWTILLIKQNCLCYKNIEIFIYLLYNCQNNLLLLLISNLNPCCMFGISLNPRYIREFLFTQCFI